MNFFAASTCNPATGLPFGLNKVPTGGRIKATVIRRNAWRGLFLQKKFYGLVNCWMLFTINK